MSTLDSPAHCCCYWYWQFDTRLCKFLSCCRIGCWLVELCAKQINVKMSGGESTDVIHRTRESRDAVSFVSYHIYGGTIPPDQPTIPTYPSTTLYSLTSIFMIITKASDPIIYFRRYVERERERCMKTFAILCVCFVRTHSCQSVSV